MNPLCTLAKEMGSNDDNFSISGFKPKDHLLIETHVEFNQEPVTEQRFPEDMDCEDAIRPMILIHTEDKSITPNEKSSGLSSSSMSQDKTGQHVVRQWQKATTERGNPLQKVTNRLGLFEPAKRANLHCLPGGD